MSSDQFRFGLDRFDLNRVNLVSDSSDRYLKLRSKLTGVSETYPKASAPDHCKRKPSKAELRIAEELFRSHLNNKTPGGSSHGINANKKKIVIGVVFHINLQHFRHHHFSDTNSNNQCYITCHLRQCCPVRLLL